MENKEMITSYTQLEHYIMHHLSLYDFISKEIELKQDGKYYKGECPLIVDCGPFKIVPESQIFYCFGCNRCGNIITYAAYKLTESPLVAALFLADYLKLDNIDKDAIYENLAITGQ